MSPEVVGRISKIAYYPVKSAAGLEVTQANLTKEGVKGDRQFMVVRSRPDNNGIHEFVTQRDPIGNNPQGFSNLALIKPEIRDEKLYLTWKGKDPIRIPDLNNGLELIVRVWDSICIAVYQGERVSNWLSDHLNEGLMLVKAGKHFEREVSQRWLSNDNSIRFQDGYSSHWFTQDSLEELNQRADSEIPWQSFRPNLVVDNLPTQTEHMYHSGKIAGIPFVQPKPCDRCPVTNVDQETGLITVGKALAPLSQYKSWRKGLKEVKVIFGENMLPQGEGKIRVGDEVVLVDLREPPLVYGNRFEV